jgi:hypothetical protein
MFRSLTTCALVGASALVAAPAMAQESCSRETLQAAVDSYIAAQTAGDASRMTLAQGVVYKEQFQPADMAAGIVSRPLAVDFRHSLLDEERCQTFTEIVVADPAHPYVLGVHLTVADGAIAEIDSIVTDDDDWLFSAEKFLAGIKDEDWGEIPEADRDSRDTIVAAADPYFAMFKDVSIQPPWHDPCYRQEGAMRTNGTCSLSAPLNVEFSERNWVVDTATGSATALVWFSTRLPDAHTFRVEDGKVRYIHTITMCDTFNCNFDLPANLVEERQARGGMMPPPEASEESAESPQ